MNYWYTKQTGHTNMMARGETHTKLRGPHYYGQAVGQYTHKWVALALGLPSYPPYAQAGAQDGAVIAISAAVRRAMHFGDRARPFRFSARGRRT